MSCFEGTMNVNKIAICSTSPLTVHSNKLNLGMYDANIISCILMPSIERMGNGRDINKTQS